MQILSQVQIFSTQRNQMIDANLIRLTADLAKTNIDDVWWNLPNVSNDELMNENDSHWNWEELVKYYPSKLPKTECVAILSQNNYIEGAMIYHFHGITKLSSSNGSVQIERVATAPHNRKFLSNQPIYKGAGTVLLYWALVESYKVGLGGRISLESLPTPDTIRFYNNKGFIRTNLTQPVDDLVDFELPETAALAWLKNEGDLR
jgi:hypothetical protein